MSESVLKKRVVYAGDVLMKLMEVGTSLERNTAKNVVPRWIWKGESTMGEDDKHVRQCSEKEIRKIFAKYGYSEELLQK